MYTAVVLNFDIMILTAMISLNHNLTAEINLLWKVRFYVGLFMQMLTERILVSSDIKLSPTIILY